MCSDKAPITWTDEFYGIVDDLDSRPELMFLSDSQQVQAIKHHIGNPEWASEYESFFVSAKDGDYDEIYGIEYTVPYSSRPVYRIFIKEREVKQ